MGKRDCFYIGPFLVVVLLFAISMAVFVNIALLLRPIVIMANEFLFLGWQWGDGQSQTNSSLLPSRKRRRNVTESESGCLCLAFPPSNQLFNSSSTHILFVVVGFLLPFQLEIFLSMKFRWRQRKGGRKEDGYFRKEVNPKVA